MAHPAAPDVGSIRGLHVPRAPRPESVVWRATQPSAADRARRRRQELGRRQARSRLEQAFRRPRRVRRHLLHRVRHARRRPVGDHQRTRLRRCSPLVAAARAHAVLRVLTEHAGGDRSRSGSLALRERHSAKVVSDALEPTTVALPHPSEDPRARSDCCDAAARTPRDPIGWSMERTFWPTGYAAHRTGRWRITSSSRTTTTSTSSRPASRLQ